MGDITKSSNTNAKLDYGEIPFVHLHNHSYYSLLDGLSSPIKMAEAASENGFKALAITDHGSCGGILAFQNACISKGIRPILGNEFYITKDRKIKEKDAISYHIILLAKNHDGLKNLMKLTSLSEIEGKYRKPRIDFDILSKYSNGLICTTACSGGELPRLICDNMISEAEDLIKKYKVLFGEDYYIEIMRHKYDDVSKDQEEKEQMLSIKLYELGKKFNVKVIATNDAHYARRTDAKYHDILLSIQTLDTIKNPDRFTFNSKDFYLKSYGEMKELFKDMPDVITNTTEIADKIEENLLFKSEDLLPEFKVPEGYLDEKSYLKSLVKDGMIVKKLINIPEYRERIKLEMELIVRCGFVRYFLILWDIVNVARQRQIKIGPGRGSGAGSLCLFVLGITKIDPIKYDLLFERFINPERISPPDVDMDFEYFRRDEVFEYVYQKYGRNNCSKIGTYNSLKSRAVIRSISKALDLGKDWEFVAEAKKKNPELKAPESKKSLEIADYVAKLVPKAADMSIEMALRESEDFKKAIMRYPELLDSCMHIEKTVSSAGVHPAGIVICKDEISDHAPMRESKEQLCTQLTGPEMEDLGLLKFDFLALKTLSVVEDTLLLIKQRHGLDLDLDELEPDDKKVFDLFNGRYKMDNRGIFQFESPGISNMVRNVRIDTFEDMIVCNALYRPGPLEAKVPEMYADYKHGRKKITYLHPKMGEVLHKTYGLMCFDREQKVYCDNEYGNIEYVNNTSNVGALVGNEVVFSSPMGGSFSNGKKEVFQYNLSNGFSISCTKDHKVLCNYGDGKNDWEEIDFAYKNNIPILYRVNESMKEVDFDKKKASICYLIGMLIGDGNLCNSSINLCCGSSKELADRMKDIYESCFDGVSGTVFFSTRCWYVRLITDGNEHKFGANKKNKLREFLTGIGLCGDFMHKTVPIKYFENNREYLRAFLAGYLDSDGCLKTDIRFTSENKILLEQTSYILWNMGYHSYLSNHALIVYESNKLWSEIKKYSFKKSNLRLSDGSSLKIGSHTAKEIIERIFNREKSVRENCKNIGVNRATINRILSLEKKFHIYRSVKKFISKEQFKRNTCLFVKNRVSLGMREVFDLSMKKESENNFIIQPGIVAHNCYQEDFMKVSQVLAGFTKGQSDTLRKVVGKKKPELIKKEKLDEKFVAGCIKNGIDEKIAKDIFQQIEYFGGYGFNKSHSCAYSFLAYQCAWLKVYYPLEFMCGLLSSEINNSDKGEKLGTYIAEADNMKIVVLAPNINKSGLKYTIEKNISKEGEERFFIRTPLTAIDGVGQVAAESIVDNKPYKDMKDFMLKINGSKVSSKVFNSLLDTGAFDDVFKMRRAEILAMYDNIKNDVKKEKVSKKKQEEYISEQGDSSFLWLGGAGTEIVL